MLKVLIVDDELKVCNLIYHLLDWPSLGLEVIGSVQDGATAYEFIFKNKPDIVITDIRIPEIDGIELIRKVKEIYPETYFIIISGYSHFEYAQKAIKFGVEDYILKPIKKKDLTEALNRSIGKHRDKIMYIDEKASLQNRINAADKLIKRNFLDDLLHKQIQTNDMRRETINETYNYKFTDSIYQAVLIKPTIPFREENWQSYDLLMKKTEDIIEGDLKEICPEFLSVPHPEGVMCIVNGTEEEIMEFRKRLKKVKSAITFMRDVFEDVSVTIGLGSTVGGIGKISESIEGARDAALERFIIGPGHMVEAERVNRFQMNVTVFADAAFRGRMVSRIEILDGDGIKNSIWEISRKALEHPRASGKLILDLYSEITNIFIFGLKSHGIADGEPVFIQTVIKDFHACGTSDEAFRHLGEKIASVLLQIGEEKKQQDRKPIRHAKQYIQNHFNSPISLEEVSEIVGFNPTYFSSVFKKETGKNFTEYLTELRIHSAKQLLINTDDSVFDIAENVGYSDFKYFSKLFKKVAGLSPSGFRKLYR